MTNRRSMFLEIAEAYWTLEEERTQVQRKLTLGGICWAVTHEYEHGVFDMTQLFFCGYGQGYWLWPLGGENDTYRSTLCCLLAAMSDKDCDELVRNARER